MIGCPTTRLLSDLSSRVERLDTTERFLKNPIRLLDQGLDVLDESFLVQFVLLLVSLRTGKVLNKWREPQSVCEYVNGRTIE